MTPLGLHSRFDNGRIAQPIVERIYARCSVDPVTGCWMWNGCRDAGGYGQTNIGSRRDGTRRSTRCHIATWEAVNGPTPAGLELDHFVCDRPGCANPDHVRPETNVVNTLRSPIAVTAINARKQSCPQCGGAYTIRPNGHRYCRPCNLAYLREYNANRHQPVCSRRLGLR